MPVDDDDTADAESQLLTLLRGEDADNFRLTVFCSDGRWTAELETFDPALNGIGKGDSFAEAWLNIEGRNRPTERAPAPTPV
jgi:hypothetical protein